MIYTDANLATKAYLTSITDKSQRTVASAWGTKLAWALIKLNGSVQDGQLEGLHASCKTDKELTALAGRIQFVEKNSGGTLKDSIIRSIDDLIKAESQVLEIIKEKELSKPITLLKLFQHDYSGDCHENYLAYRITKFRNDDTWGTTEYFADKGPCIILPEGSNKKENISFSEMVSNFSEYLQDHLLASANSDGTFAQENVNEILHTITKVREFLPSLTDVERKEFLNSQGMLKLKEALPLTPALSNLSL